MSPCRNRAACHLLLKNYDAALHDSEEGITFRPSFVKLYFRKASAEAFLHRFDDALSSLSFAMEKDSSTTETCIDVARSMVLSVMTKVPEFEFTQQRAIYMFLHLVTSPIPSTVLITERYHHSSCAWTLLGRMLTTMSKSWPSPRFHTFLKCFLDQNGILSFRGTRKTAH